MADPAIRSESPSLDLVRPPSRLLPALPLAVRRRAYRAMFLSARCLRRPWTSGLSLHFARILRFPHRRARELDREAAFFDWMAELEWAALMMRSEAGIRSDFALIRVSEPGLVQRIAERGGPVILAPLHMGAYTGCLAELMFRFFPGRPLLVLRRRDDMPFETRVMERIRSFGVEMRFLKVTDRADYLAAMRFARRGAVVVVFSDLPPSYGMPMPMPMFGLDLSFAFGLDAIARLTDAVVVPISTIAHLDHDDVRVGEPFEVRGDVASARAGAAERIRRHIRDALVAHPEQWHLWSTLGEYLPVSETVAPEAAEPAPAYAEAAE